MTQREIERDRGRQKPTERQRHTQRKRQRQRHRGRGRDPPQQNTGHFVHEADLQCHLLSFMIQVEFSCWQRPYLLL